jgi:hypothetical protein
MHYNLKLIYDIHDESLLQYLVFDNRYEVRRGEIDKIYDARFVNKLAKNVPDYMSKESIQLLIKNVWKG